MYRMNGVFVNYIMVATVLTLESRQYTTHFFLNLHTLKPKVETTLKHLEEVHKLLKWVHEILKGAFISAVVATRRKTEYYHHSIVFQ